MGSRLEPLRLCAQPSWEIYNLMTVIDRVRPLFHGCILQRVCSNCVYKPVLFPGVVSPSVGLSNFRGQNSNNVHKEDKVELKGKNRHQNVHYSWSLKHRGLCGSCARWCPRFFFLLKVLSSIQLFVHQLLRPKAAWHTADRTHRTLPNWNSFIISVTVIWQLFRKKAFFQLSDQLWQPEVHVHFDASSTSAVQQELTH